MNRRLLLKLVVAAFASLPLALPVAAAEKVTVFAAASLKNALDAANAAWSKETGNETTVSYAASSALAKQIEAAAPADLFISADLAWMDYVAEKKLIKDGFDLSGLVGDGKLAMGAVDSVPAGKYGKAALEKLGVWSSVEGKVAGAESVRAALALVSRGEAPYGIVYQTDAAADPGVAVVGTFPEDSHPPIIYPVAILSESKSAAAAAYLDFLKSDKAAPFFTEQGFTILK